jgi:hypothetical protein
MITKRKVEYAEWFSIWKENTFRIEVLSQSEKVMPRKRYAIQILLLAFNAKLLSTE